MGAESMMTGTVQRQDEAEIRQLIGEQAIAMRTRDVERLLASRYAQEIVKFDLAPPLQHTGAELLDVEPLQSWFAGFDGPIDCEVRELTVTAGEDVAFAHSLNRLSTTPHGATEKFDLWFRATVCLRKLDGTWRITHEHNSTPFYMDGSFRAAVDLWP
jgi:ketosteroid isomerase-like protein